MFARAAASVLIAGAVVLGTAGCNFLAPQRTLDMYDPGDGVSATVGEVKVLNALALASDGGEVLSLLLTIVNNTSRGQTVNLQFEANGEKVTEEVFVNAGGVKSIGYEGSEGNNILITGADADLGGNLPLFVQWGTETGSTILVPIHGESLPEYEDLVPSPATDPEDEG